MNHLTINTEYANLKTSTVAASRKNSDGSYTIYLNPAYTQERLEQAYEHEVRHIAQGHHDQEDVAEIEDEVRCKVKYLLNLQVSIVAPDFDKLLEEYEAKLQAKREVDRWMHELERKERKPTLRRQRKTEREYYPPGAYDEMKRKKQI